MSCPGCEIPGRSCFVFNSSHKSKTLRGVGHNQVGYGYGGSRGGGSEDKLSVQLFVVEDCSWS